MNNKNIIITIAAAMVLIAAAFFLGRCSVKSTEEHTETHSDTILIKTTDTLYIPKDSIVYKWKRVVDTLYLQKDTAILVEEKCYEDSLSRVVFTGIDCELDTIIHFIPRDTLIINTETTITKVEEVRSGWGITIGGYVGYGGYVNGGKVGVSPEVGLGGTIGWTYIFKHRKRARKGIEDTDLK